MEENTLSRLSSHFHAWAKGRLILTLAVVFVVFVTITLPIAQNASNGVIGLDTRFFYIPQEAFSVVASYSNHGRSILQIFYLTVDIVNPILYTSICVLLISYLFKRGFKPASLVQKLNLMPIGAAIFDLLENISIVIMLSTYPNQSRTTAWLATVGTTTKYIFIYASLALVLLGLIAAALNKFRLR